MIIRMRPTQSELCFAQNVGMLRNTVAIRAGTPPRHGCEQNRWDVNINGAIGEMMLAKYLGIYWAGAIGDKLAADVGKYYQVRATDHPYGKLIAHPSDVDWQPFVLARILLPEVHLVGWLWGGDAKQDEFWKTDVREPAFFAFPVNGMETLPDEDAIEQRALDPPSTKSHT